MKISRSSLFSLMLLLQLLSIPGLRSAQAAELELLVEAGHQACSIDSDCSLIYDRCDSCSCGIGVSREYRDAYLIKLEKLCENYDGAHCDKICAPIGLECINSRCEVSFAKKKAP